MWGMKQEPQHSIQKQGFQADTYIPFARPQFGRAYSLLGTRKDVSDSEGSQRVFLFPLVGQGCGTEAQYEEEAVEQTPGAQQLEVLEVLWRKDKSGHQQRVTPDRQYLHPRQAPLTSPPARRELLMACPIMS